MPVASDEPVGHSRKWSKRRQNQRRQDEYSAPVSKRGDDRSLGGQHPAIDSDPLESRRAALLVEAERLKIKSLPRGHGRDAKPPVGETGRGRTEPAVAVEHEHRSRRDWRVHQRVPTTGWASRIRWSKPTS